MSRKPPRIPDAKIDNLGRKLRSLRRARGWSQQAVATALGYTSHSFISEVETGKSTTPPVDLIVRLARLYEVSLDGLLLDERELPLDALREKK